MPCEQKQIQNPKKIIKQINFFAIKLNKMSDEEHSHSEFYYPEEQETAKRKTSSVVGIF